MRFLPRSACNSTSVLCGLLYALGVSLPSVTSSARADVVSTFDMGLDGWSGLATQGPASQYSWGATGGNPGGYFDFIDQASTSGAIAAPVKFLGNWSALNGVGSLRWDAIIVNTGGDPSLFGPFDADISGPGGSATFATSTNATLVGQWVTTTAPITQANWTLTSGTWTGLLADVTSLNISIEGVTNIHNPTVQNPGDHDGIDNVILQGSIGIPEPASLTLVGLGAVCTLATLSRRRRRSRCLGAWTTASAFYEGADVKPD
jgi:PEP-CTERM motif